MIKKSVFILQDTKEVAEKIKDVFSLSDEFDVVGYSSEGISAIPMIVEKKPDYLITELVISGYDGLRVIEKIRETDKKVIIVVLSAVCRDEVIQQAMAVGANYFMAKPFEYNVLKDRLLAMAEMGNDLPKKPVQKERLDEKISKIFINAGIPPHIKGYIFLREGVKMAVETPDIINNITKKLYPKISAKFDTTPSKVERAIRHAIEVAWNRGRIDSINNILGVRAYVGQEKPTNGEFIALVADKMLLEMA